MACTAMHQWVAMRHLPCDPDAPAGTAMDHLAYRSTNIVVPDPLPVHVAGAALACRAQPCSYLGASDVEFTAVFGASFQRKKPARPPLCTSTSSALVCALSRRLFRAFVHPPPEEYMQQQRGTGSGCSQGVKHASYTRCKRDEAPSSNCDNARRRCGVREDSGPGPACPKGRCWGADR